MLIVLVVVVFVFVVVMFQYFGVNNNGVEFFVEIELEQFIVYVQVCGNFSFEEKDVLVCQVELIVLVIFGVQIVFFFVGEGGLNNNIVGVLGLGDVVGQLQLELVLWEDCFVYVWVNDILLEQLDGNVIIVNL